MNFWIFEGYDTNRTNLTIHIINLIKYRNFKIFLLNERVKFLETGKNMDAHMYLYMYVLAYVCVFLYIYIYIFTFTHTHTHTHIYIYIVCVHVCVCVCARTHACACVHVWWHPHVCSCRCTCVNLYTEKAIIAKQAFNTDLCTVHHLFMTRISLKTYVNN